MPREFAPGQPPGWDRFRFEVDEADQCLVIWTSYNYQGTPVRVEARVQLHVYDGQTGDPPKTAEELAIELRAEAATAVAALNASINALRAEAQAYVDAREVLIRADAKTYVDAREALIRADAKAYVDARETAIRTDATAAIVALTARVQAIEDAMAAHGW